jgi:hypothetical protein
MAHVGEDAPVTILMSFARASAAVLTTAVVNLLAVLAQPMG